MSMFADDHVLYDCGPVWDIVWNRLYASLSGYMKGVSEC